MDANLIGSWRQPELLLRFGWSARHPSTGKPLQDWVRQLPGRRWDKELEGWLVTGTGPNPERVLNAAGFAVNYAGIDPASDLAGLTSLDDLVTPVSKLSASGRRVLVRHRLLGYDATVELLGQGASWDKKFNRFTMPLTDVLLYGKPRPGIIHDQAALDGARRLLDRVHTAPEHAALVAVAGSTTALENLTDDQIDQLRSINGTIPAWFGLNLYPFQEVGALATAAGHSGLFDGMRVGKSLGMSEPVLTPHGFIPMRDVVLGSNVVGSDGQPTEVLGVYPQGTRDIYQLTFNDGAQSYADGEHLWTVDVDGETKVVTTLDILASDRPHFIQLNAPVEFAEKTDYAISDPTLLMSVEDRTYILMQMLDERGILTPFVGNAELARSLGFSATVLADGSAALSTAPHFVTSVVLSHQEEAQCIKVAAADELFITRDFIVTHNTRTSLAAAALVKSHRTLIISPPLVVTNWQLNAEESRLATRGGKTDGKVVVIRAGKKEPEFPKTGILIVADSLVAARPELRKRIAEWKPQATILDEAHREGTYGSKRTEAVLDLAWATEKLTMALTGTPVFSSPTELVPLLEFTGHLGPVFGGVDQYLTKYTRRDKWGRNHPKKAGLEELQKILREKVWVRRTKEQVGIGMPFTHDPFVIDVDMKLFKEAHAEVTDRVDDWLDEFNSEFNRTPSDEEIGLWAAENIGLISILRRAAGLCKIPGAIELITEHVKATTEFAADGSPIYTRPLIVWTHHRDVTEAMATALGTAVEEAAMIIGGMSMAKKDKVVASFQRGEIPVIACSIIAAGVGIDLTRSADVMFVETDWTPGNVQQALDRVQGVNQKKFVSAMTLIATGTLDERIQKVQNSKGKVLGAILGGDHDVSVATNIEDLRGASEIVSDLVKTALVKRRAPARGRKVVGA